MIRNTTKLIDLRGEIAKEIQKYLGVTQDGIIGSNTLKAFAEWKKQNYLSNIDEIGPNSYNKLKEQYENNSKINLDIIKKYEGFSSTAYKDPLHGWAVPTIGYGTTVYSDGQKVKRGDTITREIAEFELFNFVNKKIIPVLESKIPYWNEMNNNQKSALVSFAYNLGPHFYGASGFETITRILSNKEWDKVPNALFLYRNPGTNVELGLKKRRIDEGKLFSTP